MEILYKNDVFFSLKTDQLYKVKRRRIKWITWVRGLMGSSIQAQEEVSPKGCSS